MMRRCLIVSFFVCCLVVIICTVGLNADDTVLDARKTQKISTKVTEETEPEPDVGGSLDYYGSLDMSERREQPATVNTLNSTSTADNSNAVLNFELVDTLEDPDESAVAERQRMLKADPPDENCNADILRKPEQTNFWVYSMISNFPGSAHMLHHWLTHYLSWGVRTENFLIICHNSRQGQEAQWEYGNITKLLDDYGIPYMKSSVAFSSESKLKALLELFQDRVKSPHDWAAYIDSDEFSDFGPQFSDVYDAIRDLEAKGHNALIGRLVDRVTSNGELRRIRSFPSIWEQFPLHCDMRSTELIRLMPRKVMMFKAYLRPNTGNHRIISPLEADRYFGPQPEGKRGARYGFFGGEDMRSLTPYSWYSGCYQTLRGGPDTHPSGQPWLKLPNAPEELRNVYHFKWHHGVVESAAKRLEWYKGNITHDGSGNVTGVPRWAHWWESAKILEWATTGFVPMNRAVCEDDAEANTRWKSKVYDAHFWEMQQANQTAAAKAAADATLDPATQEAQAALTDGR